MPPTLERVTRIIAGAFRGRSLATPRGERTRPTSERTREALFSALAVWAGGGDRLDDALDGLAFLDLFAGSGAIGLEAASRGAQPVVLVEQQRSVAHIISQNAHALGADVDVVVQSAEAYLAQPATAPFDIIWLDPPYALATEAVDALVSDAVAHGWVAPDGLVVVERAARAQAPSFGAGFDVRKPRRYGDTVVYFAQREEA